MIVIVSAVNLNAMSTFTIVRFMLISVCFFSTQQVTTANDNGCNTPQLGEKDTLLITIFENGSRVDPNIWKVLCTTIPRFPEGRITLEYRSGALATGTADNIKCGSGDCKYDQRHACEMLHSKNYVNCYGTFDSDLVGTYKCYCNKEINEVLLENARIRESWNIPESAIPTLAVNKAVDPCIKFGTIQDLEQYLCKVYQNKIGPC